MSTVYELAAILDLSLSNASNVTKTSDTPSCLDYSALFNSLCTYPGGRCISQRPLGREPTCYTRWTEMFLFSKRTVWLKYDYDVVCRRRLRKLFIIFTLNSLNTSTCRRVSFVSWWTADCWIEHKRRNSRFMNNYSIISVVCDDLHVALSRWHYWTTGSASDQQSTNDRKVAGSRPTKVVCITVLTGNRMGWTARCVRRPPLLLPSCRKLGVCVDGLRSGMGKW